MKKIDPEILRLKNRAGQTALTISARYDKKMVELILKYIKTLDTEDQIKLLNVKEDLIWARAIDYEYEIIDDGGGDEIVDSHLKYAGKAEGNWFRWDGSELKNKYSQRRTKEPIRIYELGKKESNAGGSALGIAIASSNEPVVKLILNHIKDFSAKKQLKVLNTRFHSQWTTPGPLNMNSLELAASLNNLGIVKLLLGHIKENFKEEDQLELIHSTLNAAGKNSMTFLPNRKNREVLKLVLDHIKNFSSENQSKIFNVKNGSLLQFCADKRTGNSVLGSSYKGFLKIILDHIKLLDAKDRLKILKEGCKAALFSAIQNNNCEEVKSIFEHIKDLDSKKQLKIIGSDVLFSACRYDAKNKILKLILNHIKLLNRKDRLKILNTKDKYGRTAWLFCRVKFFKGMLFLSSINDLDPIEELNIINVDTKDVYMLQSVVGKRVKYLQQKCIAHNIKSVASESKD